MIITKYLWTSRPINTTTGLQSLPSWVESGETARTTTIIKIHGRHTTALTRGYVWNTHGGAEHRKKKHVDGFTKTHTLQRTRQNSKARRRTRASQYAQTADAKSDEATECDDGPPSRRRLPRERLLGRPDVCNRLRRRGEKSVR